jgi:hypothetical protein
VSEAAKSKDSDERPTGQPSGRQPGTDGGAITVSQKGPRATAGKRKADELVSSDSGGSMEPATRHPAPRPLSRAGSAPLPALAMGSSAQAPVVKLTTSTDKEAAFSGRHLTYAEVGAAYAGVVDGRPVKGATNGFDSSAPLPTKRGAFQERKGGRDDKVFRGTPSVSTSPRGEKDVTVGTTAGGHLGDRPAAPTKPSGTLKLTATDTRAAPVPAASNEAATRRTSPRALGDVSGPLSVAPIGTPSTTVQVDKAVPN